MGPTKCWNQFNLGHQPVQVSNSQISTISPGMKDVSFDMSPNCYTVQYRAVRVPISCWTSRYCLYHAVSGGTSNDGLYHNKKVFPFFKTREESNRILMKWCSLLMHLFSFTLIIVQIESLLFALLYFSQWLFHSVPLMLL